MEKYKYQHTHDVMLIDGFYDEENDIIHISRGLSKLEREIVYFHERQHQICYNRNCCCWSRRTHYLAEYHAMTGECCSVLATNHLPLMTKYVEAVERVLTKYKEHPVWKLHYRAQSRVCKSKEYQAIKRAVKKGNSRIAACVK